MTKSQLDRRTVLKLAGSGFIYLLGQELCFGAQVPNSYKVKFQSSLAKRIADDLPPLDGAFVFDTETCTKMATDFGHFVHSMPIGVLIPGSITDVQKIILFARKSDTVVSMRGTGGAAYGQSQAKDGIVIDSSSLKAMHWASEESVYLQPGALWREVLDFTIQKNKSPMILPDTIVTSVGGTLSVGGIGETSYRMGALVDHVRRIQVITGNGELLECSRQQNSDLFSMVLGGMGQCGFIVGAELDVFDVPEKVYTREYKYMSTETDLYLEDLKLFSQMENNGAVGGHFVRDPQGSTFALVVNATYWGDNDHSWIEKMRGTTDGQIKTWSYFEYANRNTAGWDDAVKKGLVDLPHPYLSFYLPEIKTADMIKYLIGTTEANLGAGKIALFPMINKNFKHALHRIPESEFSYHLRIYRIVRDGENSVNHRAMIQSNTEDLLPRIFSAGGKVYLPFSPLLNRRQRRVQFERNLYHQFRKAKYTFDSKQILTPGAGLF